MSDFLWNAYSRAEISIVFASIAKTTNNLQIELIALLFSYYKKSVNLSKKITYILEIKV